MMKQIGLNYKNHLIYFEANFTAIFNGFNDFNFAPLILKSNERKFP